MATECGPFSGWRRNRRRPHRARTLCERAGREGKSRAYNIAMEDE